MTENADGMRDSRGRFSLGNPGKKPGTRNKTTKAVESLLAGEAEALTRKAIEMALEGDSQAIRLCLDRILPARKGRPVLFELPPMNDAKGATDALSAVLSAVADGQLTTDEAKAVADIVEAKRRAIETVQLEQRIANLESK